MAETPSLPKFIDSESRLKFISQSIRAGDLSKLELYYTRVHLVEHQGKHLPWTRKHWVLAVKGLQVPILSFLYRTQNLHMREEVQEEVLETPGGLKPAPETLECLDVKFPWSTLERVLDVLVEKTGMETEEHSKVRGWLCEPY